MLSIITASPQETRRLGAALGRVLRGGEVFALFGDLGSGKTTFVKGLARALGIKTTVTSPTFLISRAYPARGGKTLYHFDLYRLRQAREFLALGFLEVLADSKNIIILEWPEIAEKFLPRQTLEIRFEPDRAKPNYRHISLCLKK